MYKLRMRTSMTFLQRAGRFLFAFKRCYWQPAENVDPVLKTRSWSQLKRIVPKWGAAKINGTNLGPPAGSSA